MAILLNNTTSTTVQGQEEIAFVESESDDYGNYALVENDEGIVGTVTIVEE